jgi:hypothetical protein
MATQLNKPVTRETTVMDGERPVLVTMTPDNTLEFKPKGLRRKPNVLDLQSAYELAKGTMPADSSAMFSDDEISILSRCEAKLVINPAVGAEAACAYIWAIRELIEEQKDADEFDAYLRDEVELRLPLEQEYVEKEVLRLRRRRPSEEPKGEDE